MTTPEADYGRLVRRAENDIIDTYALMLDIQRTVDQHTVTLAQHGMMLAQHTALLNDHTARLGRIETRLDGVETRLDEHGGMLKEILRRLPAAN